MRKNSLLGAIMAPLLLVAVTFPTLPSQAIPTTFGGGGFINPAGMRFEDFAARPDSWKAKADLKAPWEKWNDDSVKDTSIEVIKMSLSAVVFGLPAAEVVAYRQDETVIRFVVGFQPEEDRTLSQLDKSIRRNLGAWADANESGSFTKGATSIEVLAPDQGDETIRVAFTPAIAESTTGP